MCKSTLFPGDTTSDGWFVAKLNWGPSGAPKEAGLTAFVIATAVFVIDSARDSFLGRLGRVS